MDGFRLTHAYWEEKDSDDDLAVEVERKSAAGYSRENIVFQTQERAMLWQNGRLGLDAELREAGQLTETLLKGELDWSEIAPAVWACCSSAGWTPAKRAQFGAHDIDRAKIMQIVEPVIVAA